MLNKMTKDQLSARNAKLEAALETMTRQDKEMRGVFADLLDQVEYCEDRYSSKKERKVLDVSWLHLAFLIGEMKATTDNSYIVQNSKKVNERADEMGKENMSLINLLETYRSDRCKNCRPYPDRP
jgi:hypothetical protein